MLLKDTEVYTDLTGPQPHALTNLAVAYLSLYLNHDNFTTSKQKVCPKQSVADLFGHLVIYQKSLFNNNNNDNNTTITTQLHQEQLLETPGCRTDNVFVSGVANTTRHLLLLADPKHPLLGHNAGCLSGQRSLYGTL